MSETLQEGAIHSAYTTPSQTTWEDIPDVNYFGPRRSATPLFDTLLRDHPELADLDFDTTPNTPDLYTPIEAPSYTLDSRVAEFHTSKERARAQLTDLGLDLDHDRMVTEDLGGTSTETQPGDPEVSDETIKSAAVDLGGTALGRILGKQAERVERRRLRRQERESVAAVEPKGLGSRIVNRFRKNTSDFPEEKETREKKRGRGRVAVALGAAAIVLVTGALAANHKYGSGDSQSTSTSQIEAMPRQSPSAETSTTPQPTVESVKPKRAQTDEQGEIVYTEVKQNGNLWDTISDALPKRARTTENIDHIKDQELKEAGLSDTPEGWAKVRPGMQIEFRIPR